MQEEQSIGKIEADEVLIEVIDKVTGKGFRRTLPLKYVETDNGVVLMGETLDGKPSEIHFLSELAFGKIQDVVGKGPDHDRCGNKGGG